VASVKRSMEHTVRAIRIEDRGYDDDDGPLPLLFLRDPVSGSRRSRVVILRMSGTAVVDGEDVVLWLMIQPPIIPFFDFLPCATWL